MAVLPTDYTDSTTPTGATTEYPATTARGLNATHTQINTNTAAAEGATFTGMPKPCRTLSTHLETYTIVGGTVTQIAGTTIFGITVNTGDRVLIASAPAASGAGSYFSTQPGNGIYEVTGTGANIALARTSDMSGSVNPVGKSVWVTEMAYGVSVVSPTDTGAAFTYGTTAMRWNITMSQDTAGINASQDLTNKRISLAAGSTTVAPLKFTSGTDLTTATAGAVEFDGATFTGTIDATSGRGLNPVDQMFRLTANGSALGPTIADYFGTNSAFPYVAGGVYEIVWYLAYTKTTANTVTYTITSTTAPVNLVAWYVQSAIGGIGTQAGAITAGITGSTSTAAALPVSGTQAAAQHIAEVHAIYEAHASSAGNVRLRVTSGSGTVTALRSSFYRVRRLRAGNVGTFVA